MNDSKQKQLEIAKKVWKLYQGGMNKSAVTKELSINRAEVTHIIKYTTRTQYLSNIECQNLLQSCMDENEKILKELNYWKFSDLDAYINNEKTGRKLTYKGLVDIGEEKIHTLKESLFKTESKHSYFKKWCLIFFSVMLFFIFLAGGFFKGYRIDKQNYRQIDTSLNWESQEGDTLYRLIKKI